MDSIRVLIADDEGEVRAALADLIDAERALDLVGAASDADEAIELAIAQHPDVALVDVKMPGGGGARAAREIVRASPERVFSRCRPTRTARPCWRCFGPGRSAIS